MISQRRSRAVSATRSVPVRCPGLRQPHDAAERLDRVRDALVVGGDDDGIDARGVGRTSIHVLDHGPADDIRENFSGETGRVVSGGNDGDDVLL